MVKQNSKTSSKSVKCTHLNGYLMTTRVSILWKGQTMCTLRPREAGSICYSEDAPGLSSTQQKRVNRKNTVS